MGGVRIVPDMLLADLDPADSDLLVLPGGELWDAGGGEAFAAAAERFLEAGVPVAAICGATAGLARAGLLDERHHTSAAAEYLAATGYAGGDRYVDERAVVDGDLITAGPQSPVQFARATLEPPRARLRAHARGLRGRLPPRRPGRLPGAHAGRPRDRPAARGLARAGPRRPRPARC